MTPAGFPHSDIPGSQLGCQLPRAYRRLLRPSSALDAKASTVCPSQLATTNTTPHPTRTNTDQTQRSHIDGSTLQRCSRPLSRSQTTTPHHPHDHHKVTARCGREPETPGTPTSHPHHQTPTRANTRAEDQTMRPAGQTRPDASEPQQCAPTPPQPHRTRTAQGRQSMIPLVNTTMKTTRHSPAVGACAP
jgi:hypothetical protein